MQDIKRRIKSVNSTKQITKAMELVSSAKLRKAKEKLERNKLYFQKTEQVLNDLIPHTKRMKNPFVDRREVKKVGYIVISADRGLCGGYNANVLKKALKDMGDKNSSIIAIGQKSVNFFKKKGFDIDGEFISISEKPELNDAKSISKLAIELFENELIDEVRLVYTEFVSTITHRPIVKVLLPLANKVDETDKKNNKKLDLMIYEPSPEVVLDNIIPKYMESMIYGGLIEASASEQGARRVAMESATNNANDMIEKLNLKYNRARQASITQEISEIVGGAEALN